MNLLRILGFQGTARVGYINTDKVNRLDLGALFEGVGVFERDESVRRYSVVVDPGPPPPLPPPGLAFLTLEDGVTPVAFQVENTVALLDATKFGVALTQVVPVAGGAFNVVGDVDAIATTFNAAAPPAGVTESGSYTPAVSVVGGNFTVDTVGVASTSYTWDGVRLSLIRTGFNLTGTDGAPYSGTVRFGLPTVTGAPASWPSVSPVLVWSPGGFGNPSYPINTESNNNTATFVDVRVECSGTQGLGVATAIQGHIDLQD